MSFHMHVNNPYMIPLCMPMCTCVPTAFNSWADLQFDRDLTGTYAHLSFVKLLDRKKRLFNGLGLRTAAVSA